MFASSRDRTYVIIKPIRNQLVIITEGILTQGISSDIWMILAWLNVHVPLFLFLFDPVTQPNRRHCLSNFSSYSPYFTDYASAWKRRAGFHPNINTLSLPFHLNIVYSESCANVYCWSNSLRYISTTDSVVYSLRLASHSYSWRKWVRFKNSTSVYVN